MTQAPDSSWIQVFSRLATLESEIKDVADALPMLIETNREIMERLTRIETSLGHRQSQSEERLEDHESRIRSLEATQSKHAPALSLIERAWGGVLAAGLGALGFGDKIL